MKENIPTNFILFYYFIILTKDYRIQG